MEAEALSGVKREEQKKQTADLLLRFGFEKNHLKRVEKAYPFELSGGMQQRALAAMGAASRPKWILATNRQRVWTWSFGSRCMILFVK